MPSEKFANLYETTLASPYTSGTTTLVVTSAVGAPTNGIFRLRLDNIGKTIWRVDSVSGTNFIGSAEANDANASAGNAVTLVGTRAVAERWLQSPDTSGIDAYAGISAADQYGPIWKLVRPDTGISWIWQNQGTSTIVEANGIAFLTIPNAATSIRSRLITAPGTPYSITALLRNNGIGAASQYVGLVFRESGTGKLYIFYILVNGTIQAVKFTNETTFSAVGAVNTTAVPIAQHWHWLRVTDDGTNLKFFLSTDGVNFVEYGSEGRTVFMAGGPNQVGFFANVDSSAGAFSMSLASFAQSL